MFENLTDEQVEAIEEMIRSAYYEGWEDSSKKLSVRSMWNMSKAKNSSCCVVAEKFMKSVE